MIQAAVNPETGEFLGIIIPKADLNGQPITVHGTAENWEAAMMGKNVSPSLIGVYIGGQPAGLPTEAVVVENLCPLSGQKES